MQGEHANKNHAQKHKPADDRAENCSNGGKVPLPDQAPRHFDDAQ